MIHFNIIATDEIDLNTLANQEKIFEQYCVADKDGFLKLESGYAENLIDLEKLLSFIFKTNYSLKEIAPKIFDLSEIRKNCLSKKEFENQYQNWLNIRSRENTMDEFALLTCLISYVNRNADKENLLLILEN